VPTDPMAEGINQLRRYANQRDLGFRRATSNCSLYRTAARRLVAAN
jgi:hypothetical protein